ncbi:MAG: DUF5615 family PIN-like protein [Bryobacterales bacterium]|nr:DUF5615 family PIN-like protein [Bryobacterales bacterium]
MVRYLADANLHAGIVTGCLRREPTMDFLSAIEAKLEGVADPEILAFADRENRILVTSDFKTMPMHFGDFFTEHGHCPGVDGCEPYARRPIRFGQAVCTGAWACRSVASDR